MKEVGKMNNQLGERIKEAMGDKKLPFQLLDLEVGEYGEDKLTGKLYIGVNTFQLHTIFTIDDECPSLYPKMFRKKEIKEFLQLNMPVDAEGWDSLFEQTAFSVANDYLNPEGWKVELKQFRTSTVVSHTYQTTYVIQVEMEIIK